MGEFIVNFLGNPEGEEDDATGDGYAYAAYDGDQRVESGGHLSAEGVELRVHVRTEDVQPCLYAVDGRRQVAEAAVHLLIGALQPADALAVGEGVRVWVVMGAF